MNGLEWIVRIAAGLGGGVLVLFLLAGALGAIARKREVKAQREAKAQKAKSEFCPNCMPMNLPKDMQSAYYSFVVMDGWLYHNDGYRGGKVAKVKYRKIAKINYCPWCGRALK